MKRVAWLWLGLFVPAVAWCAQPHIEESMVVTGTITVGPDGGVQSYMVHDLDKLPPAARQIVQATVPRWRFVPVTANGKAVAVEAGMSLRIIADMIDKTHVRIRVAGAEFGCEAGRARNLLPDACPKGSTISYAPHPRPPQYPLKAVQARVGGEVFLAIRIGRDGRVTQVAAQQVNLYEKTDAPVHYRRVLADASMDAARRWRFAVPTTGPNADKDDWVVQVPISYWIGMPSSAPTRHYGQWNAYIPGPVQDVPWADQAGAARGAANAVAGNGTPFVRDTRLVLKTPLTNGVGQS